MAEIRVAVEGQSATTAVQALLAIEGVSGDYVVEAETEREGTLAVIATLIGIVGGTLAIAEQIRSWYQEYRQGKSGKSLKKVVIVGRNGDRLILENASVEQIQKILES
ncbi:MAG: hypothetical protein F6J95_019855 [Leptolyngbya sp. SIO1E4]|nr:hypothetical protein [Leptolyngbya sp. SIO1E4]